MADDLGEDECLVGDSPAAGGDRDRLTRLDPGAEIQELERLAHRRGDVFDSWPLEALTQPEEIGQCRAASRRRHDRDSMLLSSGFMIRLYG